MERRRIAPMVKLQPRCRGGVLDEVDMLQNDLAGWR